MTKKSFIVGQWFNRDIDALQEMGNRIQPKTMPGLSVSVMGTKNRFPSFANRRQVKLPEAIIENATDTIAQFTPHKFLNPGWTGESLAGKEVARFLKLLDIIKADVEDQLCHQSDFPRTLKQNIYNEFMVFANHKSLHLNSLDNIGSFWNMLKKDKDARPQELSEFISLYSYRVAVVNFFKIRFIKYLGLRTGMNLTSKAALYPTSFLGQIFKKGTKTELQSRALESNIFSWYRPSETHAHFMIEWLDFAERATITELIKFTSTKVQESHSQSKVYSHALSHVNFGLFINSLLINLPLWLETFHEDISNNNKMLTADELEIISCKFSGDYLESMALSHWLAQENNKTMKWDQVLCPDFKGSEFETGLFTKIINELQFLTFLADKAQYQDENPINYICKIIGHHFQNRKSAKNRHYHQLLDLDGPFFASSYDRLILNLCNFPKNNPHHFLVNQILEQVESIKVGGYLVVLAGKNLFINSQKEKIEKILQVLDVKAIFDLESIKGKGEAGDYVYVFRRRSAAEEAVKIQDKQICHYFRLKGEVQNFQYFSDASEYLRDFFLTNLGDPPPLFQQEYDKNFRLEFYQDAIINGLLIHSTSEDTGRITHPNFFKGLMDSCLPLDYVFDLKTISPSDIETAGWQSSLNLKLKRDLTYFLMVDFRFMDEVRVELQPIETLRSTYNECGSSQCHYFMLTPKHQGINSNLLRKYFHSQIGRQILNLTFNAGPTKVKSQLSKILIPKFLTEIEQLPESLKAYLIFFSQTPEQLLEIHPLEAKKHFIMLKGKLSDLSGQYNTTILTALCHFERVLSDLIGRMEEGKGPEKFNFNNPLVKQALLNLPTIGLMPSHKDIYVEFVEGLETQDLQATLDQTHIKLQLDGEIRSYYLELHSSHGLVVKLFSDEEMLHFIEFLLSKARGVTISNLLKALHLPLLKDLQKIIGHNDTLKISFKDILEQTRLMIEEGFRRPVLVKRSIL